MRYILPIAISIVLSAAPETCAESDDTRRTPVETLYGEGMRLFEAGNPEAALQKFREALGIDKKHAPSLVGMGHVHLQRGDLDKAEDAFMDARRRKRKYGPAHNGLGMVYMRKEKGLQWAIRYFQDAISVDRTYAEAYYNLAGAYRAIGDTKELMAYRRLSRIVPTHPDVWFRIGRIYKNGEAGEYVQSEKAEAAFRRQLEVNPDHVEARLDLGEVLTELARADEAVPVLTPLVESGNPLQQRSLAALAEACLKQREFDRADVLFDRYLEGLGADTQAVYYDLRKVAESGERDRFEAAPPAEWKALSEAYWAGRDPAPATAANERKLEHYRRVAYSLEHFGKDRFPWDVRGDVYVRYGRPAHVSSSENIRFETDPKAIRIKERIALHAGDALSHMLRIRNSETTSHGGRVGDLGEASVLGPVSGTLRESEEAGVTRTADGGYGAIPLSDGSGDLSGNLRMTSGILGWPVYPVSGKVWEYWIYTDVGPGMEITFTRTLGQTTFKFADMPSGKGGHSRHLYTWQRMNPKLKLDHVGRRVPTLYRPTFATGPLAYFFDSAGFKGAQDASNLEVYYGIPLWELAFNPGPDGKPTARLKNGVALYNDANEPVLRRDGDFELFSDVAADTARRAFVPEILRVSAPPGRYRMSVQVIDTGTGRSQVYEQQVLLPSFARGYLRLSGIQMAASIRPATDDRFRKGDIQVVPNPTRTYERGQSVFIYYEVYNLKRDDFGATRYRVAYEMRSALSGSVGARIRSGIGKLLNIRQHDQASISIEYAHIGNREDDQGYVELDMAASDPGEKFLRVTVTDQASGQTTTGTTRLTIR
ncbi:MAG: tetratricopeptide repeat protein [Gemmatimonadota bacterium]|nr:tetratricopeptide repeat protein [Gemmatimonadota bacterium]